MAKIISSFDQLWGTELEAQAKTAGVIDGDLPRVRASVKNALISADWAAKDGSLCFSSEADQANALKAASEVLTATAHRLTTDRRVVTKPVGSPTRSQVLLAASTSASPTAFSSVSPVRQGAFTPELAKSGDKCPRCNGSMDPVGLVNDRAALYCARDRVVLPLSSDATVRY